MFSVSRAFPTSVPDTLGCSFNDLSGQKFLSLKKKKMKFENRNFKVRFLRINLLSLGYTLTS